METYLIVNVHFEAKERDKLFLGYGETHAEAIEDALAQATAFWNTRPGDLEVRETRDVWDVVEQI